MKTALRANALFDVALALLLLAATWDGLYAALDLPTAQALFAQLGGAALLAFGYLLWIAPRHATTVRVVAAASTFANGFSALVLAAWLFTGEADAILLWVLFVALTAFAAVEAWFASRSVAILLPPD